MARVEISEVVLKRMLVPVGAQSVPLLAPGENLEVTVNVRGGGPATVFEAETGPEVIGQPLTTDEHGRIDGWLEEGSYDLEIASPPDPPYVQPFEAAKGGASGGGAPSGPAGGVLSGNYPNPGFAQDMATQAELNAHAGQTEGAHGLPNAAAGQAIRRNPGDTGWEGFDPATQTELDGHAAVTEGVHGLPNAAAGQAIRRNAGDTAWEAFDPATQAELDAHATDTTAVHGVGDTAGLPRVIVHGSNANVARGSDAGIRIWIGSVQPANWQPNDVWMNTA